MGLGWGGGGEGEGLGGRLGHFVRNGAVTGERRRTVPTPGVVPEPGPGEKVGPYGTARTKVGSERGTLA